MLRLLNRTYVKTAFIQKRKLTSDNSFLNVSEEVKCALEQGLPLVALESTLITHGMPYPQNFKIAEEVNYVVRDLGVIPATVAVKSGKICVGLSKEEVHDLSKQNLNAHKVSRRDLTYSLAKGLIGGATVSTTMIAAHAVGIPIFITGGIGGVHRGGELSMDISADLTELGRTPVTIISAGVKSLLDIARTLECLETLGVCVATFGPTKDFPAFFTADSGSKSPYNITTTAEAAQLIDTHHRLGLKAGMLIAVPIPEESAADGIGIEAAIERSVREASDAGIHGKDITPYCLKRINELSLGKSLLANIDLYKNNAKIGSQIAVELAKLRQSNTARDSTAHSAGNNTQNQGRPVVIGGTVVDFLASLKQKQPTLDKGLNEKSISKVTCNFSQIDGRTHPGSIRLSLGGVGCNLADALSRFAKYPLFISAVGQDRLTDFVLQNTRHMDHSGITVIPDASTATCCSIHNDQGELLYGIGDMEVHDKITPDYVSKFLLDFNKSPLVVMDGNIPIKTMEVICEICEEQNIPIWYEPTDVLKCTKAFTTEIWKSLTYISPNVNELKEIIRKIDSRIISENVMNFDDRPKDDVLKAIAEWSHKLIEHIHCVVVTLGNRGVLICRNVEFECPFPVRSKITALPKSFSAVYYPSIPAEIKSVTGCGDCLAAGMMAAILSELPPDICVKVGLIAASLSLPNYTAVPPDLSPELLKEENVNSQYTLEPIRIY